MSGNKSFKNKRIHTPDHNPRAYKTRSNRLNKKLSRRKRFGKKGGAVKGAQNQLKNFRQASILAIALTGFLLMLLTPGEAGYSEDTQQQDSTELSSPQKEELPDSVAIIENVAVEDLVTAKEETETTTNKIAEEDISEAAKNEALASIRRLWEGFYSNLPKILVAIAVLVIAWLIIRLTRFILKKTVGHWNSSEAIISITAISLWLLAIGAAISIVAGDIRALVGSLGLIGLALSWSLQTPIESFTGWLLNSFQGYYRVGDRISVGDVFGDVYRIDFLNTTVWEIGAPYRQGFVQAEQPTGRLVTFPNNEILTGTVVNLTGDFPYVWDELAISVANESNIKMAMEVIEKVALQHLGNYMREPAERYAKILQKAGLSYPVPEKPQVFVSTNESWTDIIIRYLVGARERRKWKSELSILVVQELSKPEYAGKIKSAYPRQQLQFINSDGVAVNISEFQHNSRNS